MAHSTAIYQEAGGAPGIEAAVNVLYARVLADAELAPYFDGVDLDRLKSHQRQFLGVAFGGPELYRGRDLEVAHAGLGITEASFDRLVDHLAHALEDLGLAHAAVTVVRARLDALRSSIVV